MQSDGNALFLAICAQPWEDTPRLAYADWLDENGDPRRAEYIRLEVAIEERIRRRQTLSPNQVARRQQLHAFERKWMKKLPKLPGVKWEVMFERGFPRNVNTTSATAFLKHAEVIYRSAPVGWLTIRSVSAKTVVELPRSPYLSRLRGLDLRGCRLGDHGVRELCASPHLSRLEVLNLSRVGMTDAGATAIANCRGLGELWALLLHENAITDTGARALANSPHFPKLTDIDHDDTQITAAGTRAMKRLTDRNQAKLPDWTTDPADAEE
jgi:uncharacterized protein (TIGR02996 family)